MTALMPHPPGAKNNIDERTLHVLRMLSLVCVFSLLGWMRRRASRR